MSVLKFSEFINERFDFVRPTEKKAIKIFNIKWELDEVSPEERVELEKTLPKKKGFTVDYDFDVVDKIPGILKSKYGCGVKNFSFNEYRIVESLEELLYLCLEEGEKRKRIFRESGSLGMSGKELASRLALAIKKRKKLESEGTDEFKMPKLLDEIMLGICNIYEIDWKEKDVKSILKLVSDDIESRAKAKKADEFEEVEDEDGFEEVDDEDDEIEEEPEEKPEPEEEPEDEDSPIYFDKKTKRYYFKEDDCYYMEQDAAGDYRVYDDGEYEGKYCGSLTAIKSQEHPLDFILSAI